MPLVDYRPRQRLHPDVVRLRERLARLEPGGTPSRPMEVESASQIEVRAEGTPCLRCQGPYRVDEHTAESIAGKLLRVVDVHCQHCGAERIFYFRVVPPLEVS